MTDEPKVTGFVVELNVKTPFSGDSILKVEVPLLATSYGLELKGWYEVSRLLCGVRPPLEDIVDRLREERDAEREAGTDQE